MDDAQLLKLASDVVRDHGGDQNKLAAVKSQLLAANSRDGRVMWCLAGLAVLTDDETLWDHMLKEIGPGVDPGLGYHAFQTLRRNGASQAQLDRWSFVMESSAKQGYLAAQHEVFARRMQPFGLMSRPVVFSIFFGKRAKRCLLPKGTPRIRALLPLHTA